MSRIGLLLLFAATLGLGQSTSVTLQVTDTDSQSWNNGTWTATLTSNASSGPFAILGTSTPVPNQSQSGALSASGSATMTLTPNASIGPIGTQWAFHVCPQANPAACYDFKATIQGASQNLTLTPPGIRISVVNPVILVSAYLDIEVFGQAISSTYYNLTSSVTRQWNGTNWVTLGGSGSTGGTVKVCDTSTQVGADLGARIVACDVLLGGIYAPLQQGNLAYNPNPTYGVIRVNTSDVGPISTFPVFVSAGHTLSLGPGLYTNALASAQPMFLLANDANLVCDGWNTILQNSSNNANGDPRVVGMASTYQVVGGVPQANVPDSTGFGIRVEGCHFTDSGLGKQSTLTATVVMTNCKHCKVLHNWFDGIAVTGVGLIGTFFTGANCINLPNWTAQYCQNFGDGNEVAGNEFNGTQEAISVINNDNTLIHDNKMRAHSSGAAGYIDLESNTSKDHMQYGDIHDNIWDCSIPQINTGCYGVTMQSVGPFDGWWKIHDNVYYGPYPGTSLTGQTTQGISWGNSFPHGTHNAEIYNNHIFYTTNNAITIEGVDFAYVHDNLLVCDQGGITVGPYMQYSVVANNRLQSPPLTSYAITSVAATTDNATTVYTGTFGNGGSSFLQSQIVTISGFTNSVNNGTFGVSASTTTTLTVFNPSGVSETHAATGNIGCSSTLGQSQNFTQINETDTTDDFNLYRDNIGVGQIIVKGTHSQIMNMSAPDWNGGSVNAQTFTVPVGLTQTIPGGIATGSITAPTLNTLGPTEPGTCGNNLAQNTYFYIVTAVDVTGIGAPSNEVSINGGGAFGCPKLGWTYSAGAAKYNVYRSLTTGTELLVDNVPQGTLGYTDAGGQTPGAAVPTVNPTGGVQLTSLTFAKLPASPNGTVFYCSDCKNVTDDTTGTFDSVAASGGHGTNVLRENGAWRVH